MSDDRPDLVMFDYDGVIVDSFEVFSSAFLDACRAVGVPGVETADDLLAIMEGNFYESMRARGVDDARVVDVLARLAQALLMAQHWLKPFPLMPQVLEELGEERTVVVVTSSPSAVVEGWLRRHQVSGIAEVVGAEAARSKVEKIQALTARFRGQDVYWYVGDTAGDMREARAAGVTPLGVGWGWHDPDMLTEAGAERIAATPAELLTIVAPELAQDFFGLG